MTSACSVTISASAAVVAGARPHEEVDGHGPLVRTVEPGIIEEAVPPRLRKKIDRFSQMTLCAVRQVRSQFEGIEKHRVGVFIGNDFAGWNYVYEQTARMIGARDPLKIDPYVATAWFPAAAQGEATIAYGLLGESKTFSAGLLSGALALEYAARMVERGALDVALAGGVEAPDAPAVLQALANEGRISAEYPAAEAVGLLALRHEEGDGLPRLTVSRPRRTARAALADVSEVLQGAASVCYYPPPVSPHNPGSHQILSETVALLRECFGSRLTTRASACSGLDVGSASFPLSVIEASKSEAAGVPALVLGTDFEGLYVAATVVASG